MVSAFYILHSADLELEYSGSVVILQRLFTQDLPDTKDVINGFDTTYRTMVPEQRTPIMHCKGVNYIYLRAENDVIFLIVTRRNVDVMLMILFLHHFQKLLKFYLHQADLDCHMITDNVFFVYELLDECIDVGIIQMTDYNILKEYIKVRPNQPKAADEDDEAEKPTKKETEKLTKKEALKIKSTHNQAVKADQLAIDENHINSSILRASSLAINWRPKGINYAKNEIFIDIVESCDFLYDLEKEVILNNEVRGNCLVKCYLSGMPVCVVGFNENRISKISNDDDVETLREGNQLTIDEQQDPPDEDQDGQDEDQPETKDVRKHIPFTSIQFHQCVELDSVYKQNLMKFIPPDDRFTLMSYHVEQQRQRRKLPLIMIRPIYKIHRALRKLQIMCVLSTAFKRRLHGKNVVIRLPINPMIFRIASVDDLRYKTELGTVNFQIDSYEVLWKIDKIEGNNPSIKMMAELQLDDSASDIQLETISESLHTRTHFEDDPPDDNEEAIKELDRYYGVNGTRTSLIEEIQNKLRTIKSFNHIKVSFNVPMLSYTGLRLNYLKVDEDKLKYTCFPWVRYVTESGQDTKYRFKLGTRCFQCV